MCCATAHSESPFVLNLQALLALSDLDAVNMRESEDEVIVERLKQCE